MNPKIIATLFPDAAARIAQRLCPTCGKAIGAFVDDISRREYLISGMCQECQDEVFRDPADDDGD